MRTITAVIEAQKSPAPEQASEATATTDLEAIRPAETIVDSYAAEGNETRSKLVTTDALETADHGERTSIAAEPAAAQQLDVEPLIYPDRMHAALQEVLGMPNFTCAPFAHSMRAAGATIRERSEDEQAAVLHWLTRLVLKHGNGWREHAERDLQEMRAVAARREREAS
ncbi:hypothetical protein [Burkholderia stagnalis]|uniref:hypothetical protein n=1 Tax=Burkholderia stagnalis TaxID=1503054 RepID=UPI00325A65BB